MKLELEFFGSVCMLHTFMINNVQGDYRDFGEKYDSDPEDAPDYGCGNMQFTRAEPTERVLEKYASNKAEYALVAGQLEEGLSFGVCVICVHNFLGNENG